MPRSVKAPLVGCFACVGGLVLLALLAYGAGSAQRADSAVLAEFVTGPGARADSLASGLVHLADPSALLLMLALACGIGLARDRPRSAAAALAVIAAANLTTYLLKALLAHPRFRAVLDPEPLAWDGFPSGHVTAAASAAIAFAFVVPRRLRPAVGALGALFVIAVGCSVLVLNWHRPSDVLGGVLVASGWGFAALAALRAVRGARSRRIGQLGRRAAISVK